MSSVNSSSNQISISIDWLPNDQRLALNSNNLYCLETTLMLETQEQIDSAFPSSMPDGPFGRYYRFRLKDFKTQKPAYFIYPSVTTHLQQYTDKTLLEEWRNNIGHERADRITQVAASNGSELHSVLEGLFKGEKLHSLRVNPFIAKQLKGMLSVLKERLKTVYFSEEPLYSLEHKLGGRTDLIGTFILPEHTKPNLCVIDFKTTRRAFGSLNEIVIDTYLYQSALYAKMCSETYGVYPSHVVLLIAHPDGQISIVWNESFASYALYIKMIEQKILSNPWYAPAGTYRGSVSIPNGNPCASIPSSLPPLTPITPILIPKVHNIT